MYLQINNKIDNIISFFQKLWFTWRKTNIFIFYERNYLRWKHR